MDPEYIDAILERASRLLESGQPRESLRWLNELEGQPLEDRERLECVSLQAWALSEIDRFEDALETLEPLLDEFPEAARLHTVLGIVLSNANALEEARDSLELAVSLDEEDATAVLHLAVVCEKLRDYDDALRFYDRAMSMGADIDWLMQRMAGVQCEIGEYAAAKMTLKRYLSLVPEDAVQWITLAILHSDDGEYEQAANCYQTAEQLDPKSAALRLNWGVTAVRIGDLELARQQLEQLDPASIHNPLLHAFILEEDGDLASAEAAYDHALERVDENDHGALTYALEMAMDFAARHAMRSRCEQLLDRAYAANACTVELCEAYREATGQLHANTGWFSIMIEADYRGGLSEIREDDGVELDAETLEPIRTADDAQPRFLRNYQVVAEDRDAAVAAALELARRMGETGVRIREFANEDVIEDAYAGIYEIEKDSLVFTGRRPA